jgi:hypothetical protein
MDLSFHGGSNDTIGGHFRHQRPEMLMFSHGGGPVGPHLCHRKSLYTLTSIFGGKGCDKKLPSAQAAALWSRSDVIRIVFSLPMSPSLVC